MSTRRPLSDEQITRNWTELLQELRVTQTGVQILAGFLLTVPFSNRFHELDHTERVVYLVVLSGAMIATALIVAPVAFHHRAGGDRGGGRLPLLRRPLGRHGAMGREPH